MAPTHSPAGVRRSSTIQVIVWQVLVGLLLIAIPQAWAGEAGSKPEAPSAAPDGADPGEPDNEAALSQEPLPPEASTPEPEPTPSPSHHSVAITLWNGVMTNGNLGESLLFDKGFRSEYIGGVGVQADLLKGRWLSLVVDANLLGHSNRSPAEGFLETTLGLGLRAQANRWLAFTVVEGISWYNERSRQQLQEGGNGRQLVNYLAFEADANLNPQLSLVARLHHRSGIYGTLNCNKACDNNGYLLGVRYRFRP